jgi:ABC-type uncharacterized transport system auxiliary subunit
MLFNLRTASIHEGHEETRRKKTLRKERGQRPGRRRHEVLNSLNCLVKLRVFRGLHPFYRLNLLLSILAAILLPGCSSLIVSSTPPPVYYQLDYAPPEVSCGMSFREGVRVRQFTASSPFDRAAMVVTKPKGEVLYSNAFQWVSPPGTLVAESLLRDLNQGDLFPQAVSGADTTVVPLELTGHVFAFAWQRTGSAAYPVLKAEVSLTGGQPTGRVVFRKNYRLQGKALGSDDAEAFAGGMSALVRDFSERLQQDLCNSLGEIRGDGQAVR